MIAIRAVGSEAVGINLSLRTLVGRAVLTYRVQSSGSADNHIYWAKRSDSDRTWHTEQTSVDLRSAPKVFYSILAPRINEGCPQPSPAELHIARVRVYSTE